jgi:hypothetical protein
VVSGIIILKIMLKKQVSKEFLGIIVGFFG